MIHVDVRRRNMQNGQKDPYGFVVETSTDGGPWATQWTLIATVGDDMADVQKNAEELARAFVVGARYAGAEVRATSMGYAL